MDIAAGGAGRLADLAGLAIQGGLCAAVLWRHAGRHDAGGGRQGGTEWTTLDIDEAIDHLGDREIALADGRAAWNSEYTGTREDGTAIQMLVASAARGGRLFSLMAFGEPDDMERQREAIDQIIASIALESPQIYGIPRDQALVWLGGESQNPRAV